MSLALMSVTGGVGRPSLRPFDGHLNLKCCTNVRSIVELGYSIPLFSPRKNCVYMRYIVKCNTKSYWFILGLATNELCLQDLDDWWVGIPMSDGPCSSGSNWCMLTWQLPGG